MSDDMQLPYAKQESVVGEEIRRYRRLKSSTLVKTREKNSAYNFATSNMYRR